MLSGVPDYTPLSYSVIFDDRRVVVNYTVGNQSVIRDVAFYDKNYTNSTRSIGGTTIGSGCGYGWWLWVVGIGRGYGYVVPMLLLY